ncbi:helix-turn-helix domain-containing protein [Metabacillus idriensis]|uniref:helix-turn-helix domain-containing protein n=1 Tax=Metabacillus idriensis TaxID=324768 RepID=UPI0035C24E7E
MNKRTRLRQIREQRGVPIGLLAQHLNISFRVLLSIERNKKSLEPNQIRQICTYFDIRVIDLFE